MLEAKDAHFYLGQQKKREKMYDAAIASYLSALHFVDERKQLQIYEDLAIIYEHHLKDYETAMKYAQLGFNLLYQSQSYKTEQKIKRLSQWEKRILRLENKK